MKKIFLFLSLVAGLSVAAQDNVSEKRTARETFSAIVANDGIQLVLTQSDVHSIEASAAEQKFLDKLKTEVENGVLKIYYDEKNWSMNSKRKELKVKISLANLTRLVVKDGCSVTNTNNFELNDIDIKCNDGSSIKLTNFNTKTLSALVQDGSSFVLTGKTTKLDVDVNDGSSFKGSEFVAETCIAKANDGSSVLINVTKELTANANDGSSIKYEGNPALKQTNARDGSSIKKGK